MGEGRPPAKLMMPGFSVTFRISRITEGFILAARAASTQGLLVAVVVVVVFMVFLWGGEQGAWRESACAGQQIQRR